MTVIAKKDWEYVLFKKGNDYILSVVCGTVVVYDTEIKLSREQLKKFEKEGNIFLDALAEEIRFAPEKFNES